jgi:hypothetical protein
MDDACTLERRVRTGRPAPRVQRLVLTEADYLIFDALDRHGPLPSNYLYEFTRHLRRDRTHLQNRLTEFLNGDRCGPYLTRPPRQFASYRGRYQHLVYDLAPRARRALAERGTVRSYAARRCDPFIHRLMTACVGSSIELTATDHGVRFISLDEILAHRNASAGRANPNPLAIVLSDHAVIPDILFGLEYPGKGFRFFAVEVDRNTEAIERTNLRQSALARKFESYVRILGDRAFQPWWGIPNLHILTVTTSEVHARNIVDYLRASLPADFHHLFACRAEPDFGADWSVPQRTLSSLLNDPWLALVGTRWLAVV